MENVDNTCMAYRDKYDPRNREARLRHYYKNKQPYLARAVATRLELRAIMVEEKSKPCMDCGGTFPPVAMDFDHRDPLTKLRTPSHLPGSGSLRLMQEELAKCDLVCSNCHRLREASRRVARAVNNQAQAAVEESPDDDGRMGQLSMKKLWS